MKGFEHPTYVIAYIISNVVALLLLWASLKNARLSRLLFFLLRRQQNAYLWNKPSLIEKNLV